MEQKKHGGIEEILASGQAPGCIVRNNGAGSMPQHCKTPLPPGVDPKQFERAAAYQQRELERRAERTAEMRRGTRRQDGEMRHVGSATIQQVVAINRKYGGRQNVNREVLEREGVIFKHEKGKALRKTKS